MARNTTVRLIGGSQHGQMKDVTGLNNYRVTAREPHRVLSDMDAAYAGAYSMNYETYERRTLVLSGSPVTVFVLDRLSDAAASRALADFIEGVQR